MAHIRLSNLTKTNVDRDTTDEPYRVTVTLTDENSDVVEFRFSGMADEETSNFRHEIRELLKQLDDLLEDWETLPDYDHDGFISPPHENRHKGWWVKIFNRDVATDAPSRDIAIFLIAEAMTEAGEFCEAWETGRDWKPEPIDDEVRAMHDEGGTDLIPLEGVQWASGIPIEFKDPDQDDEWESGTVHRDFGQHGVWIDGYGEGAVHFVEDRDDIRPWEDEQ